MPVAVTPDNATLTDIFKVVEAFHTGEGADTNRALYVTKFNEGLDQISMRCPGFDTYWNNDADDTTYGRLSQSGQYVTFPSDVKDIYPRGVLWDEDELVESTIREFSEDNEDWRGEVAIPSAYARTARGIVLDREPASGTDDGTLVIWGLGVLPHYAENETVNPLTYLVLHHQLALAQYVIGNLPMEYRDKGEEAIVTMREARRDARRLWKEQLPYIVHGLKIRTKRPLGVKL